MKISEAFVEVRARMIKLKRDLDQAKQITRQRMAAVASVAAFAVVGGINIAKAAMKKFLSFAMKWAKRLTIGITAALIAVSSKKEELKEALVSVGKSIRDVFRPTGDRFVAALIQRLETLKGWIDRNAAAMRGVLSTAADVVARKFTMISSAVRGVGDITTDTELKIRMALLRIELAVDRMLSRLQLVIDRLQAMKQTASVLTNIGATGVRSTLRGVTSAFRATLMGLRTRMSQNRRPNNVLGFTRLGLHAAGTLPTVAGRAANAVSDPLGLRHSAESAHDRRMRELKEAFEAAEEAIRMEQAKRAMSVFNQMMDAARRVLFGGRGSGAATSVAEMIPKKIAQGMSETIQTAIGGVKVGGRNPVVVALTQQTRDLLREEQRQTRAIERIGTGGGGPMFT